LVYGQNPNQLSDETEKKLRSFVTSKYPEKTLGKLSEVVEISVLEYLEKRRMESELSKYSIRRALKGQQRTFI
jgi:hypothetical protein